MFADQVSQRSDATGTTVKFTFNDGLAAGGFHLLAPGQSSGDTGNDLWFGGDVANYFDASASHDAILVGGASSTYLTGGNGWDFIDGGAGHDTLSGGDWQRYPARRHRQRRALRRRRRTTPTSSTRGDGADTVLDDVTVTTTRRAGTIGMKTRTDQHLHHDWVTTTTTSHPDAGRDTLVFGPGIAVSDVAVQFSAGGQNLIVGVRDAAHPACRPTSSPTGSKSRTGATRRTASSTSASPTAPRWTSAPVGT